MVYAENHISADQPLAETPKMRYNQYMIHPDKAALHLNKKETVDLKKRIASGLLALTLAVGGAMNAAPLLTELAPAIGASAESFNGFEYADGGGMIRITGYSGSSTTVTVPAEIDGTPVVAVGNGAFANNRNITKVIIPEGVTTIVDSAFEGCTALKTVELPDGLQSIGMWAFLSCISLESITVPDSVWSLGQYAFDSCTSLKRINIPARVWDVYPNSFNRCRSLVSIDVEAGSNSCCTVDGMLYNKAKTELIKAPGGLEYAVIPEGTEAVAADAFRDSSLTAVKLPDSLTSVGKYALYDCPGLKEVTVPASVDTIGERALGFCYDYTTHTMAPVEGFVICCFRDTAAHRYAVNNGLDFLLLDGMAAKISLNVKYDKEYDLSKAEVTVKNGSSSEKIPASAPGIYLVGTLDEGEYTAAVSMKGFAAQETVFRTVSGSCTEVTADLYRIGDVNCDASVDMKDLVTFQRANNGWDEKDFHEFTADVYKDGSLDMRDITALQRSINGWEDDI